jgi:hypothetical protein
MPFSTDTSVMTEYPNFLPVQRPYLDILMITLAYSSSITGCLSVNTHRKVTNNTNLSVQTAQTTDSTNLLCLKRRCGVRERSLLNTSCVLHFPLFWWFTAVVHVFTDRSLASHTNCHCATACPSDWTTRTGRRQICNVSQLERKTSLLAVTRRPHGRYVCLFVCLSVYASFIDTDSNWKRTARNKQENTSSKRACPDLSVIPESAGHTEENDDKPVGYQSSRLACTNNYRWAEQSDTHK